MDGAATGERVRLPAVGPIECVPPCAAVRDELVERHVEKLGRQ